MGREHTTLKRGKRRLIAFYDNIVRMGVKDEIYDFKTLAADFNLKICKGKKRLKISTVAIDSSPI